MALVHNNTICDCNQGRGAAVYGIRIGTDGDDMSGYPAASAKISVDGNHTDAATRLHNPHSVTLQSTADPVSSFDDSALVAADAALGTRVTTLENAPSVSNPLTLESSSASTDAKLELKNTANNGKCELVVSNLTFHDRKWGFINKNSSELAFRTDEGQYGGDTAFLISKSGNVCFVGSNVTEPSETGSYGLRALSSVLFEHDKFVITSLPSSNPGVDNRVFVDKGVLKLSVDYSPQTIHFDGSQGNTNASQTSTWYQLPQSHALTIFSGGSGGYPQLYSYCFILPEPHDDIIGATIEVHHMSQATSYAAFSQLTNGGPLGTTYVQVVDSSGVAGGGVAGAMAVKVSGTTGFAKFVLLKSSTTFFWTCSTGGEWVNRSAL
jgi:hypothetical protein